MKGWKKYKIGNICTRVCSGGTPKSTESAYYGGSIPWLNTKEINFNQIYETERYITQSGLDNSSAKWIESDSVIVAMYGATAAKVAINKIPLTTNQACCNLAVNKTIADYRYVYYYLCNNYSLLASLANGGAQQNLNAQQIKDFEIPLPPLATQQHIAGILGALDDKIELNRRINANLEEQARALFKSWFVENSRSTDKIGTLRELILAIVGGDWGQEASQGNYTHRVYCIRGTDIPTLKQGAKGKMPTRYILEKNFVKKKLSAQDLVIEISGGSPSQSTGRVCLITEALLNRLGTGVVCTNFCRAITPKPEYAYFIYLYWQYLYDRNTMFGYENGTTGIKNLNITDVLERELIIIPCKDVVAEWNGIIEPLYKAIYANGAENEKLAALRDALLPKLMRGEIMLG